MLYVAYIFFSLYPCDLIPLTRKPVVVVIDSDNSHIFLQLGQQKDTFGQPFIVLCSAEVSIGSPFILEGHGSLICPSQQSSGNRGSIFTLFLHCPLAALCALCGVKFLTKETWNQLEVLLSSFYTETLDYIREESQHNSDWEVYLKLFGDDFLRITFLRYLFCHTVYSMHKESQVSQLMQNNNYLIIPIIVFPLNSKIVWFLGYFITSKILSRSKPL